MYDDILVPTDGSACAEVATGYAEDIAARYGATVHTLSVVDARLLEDAPQYDAKQAEQAELAEHASERLSEADINAEPVVRTGVPHRIILTYVDEQGIDLIVMGTHGQSGVERYLLGGVTEKVIRLADVPVMAVPETAGRPVRYPYDDILIPTDGSDRMTAAIDHAIDIAAAYGARLHALAAVDAPAWGIDIPAGAVLDALEESAHAAVRAVEARAAGTSVAAVETTVVSGSPYREIREYVADESIDLVVMGTHGRSGIDRYLLGSVAEKTVRSTAVPVMTVRYPDAR